MIELKCWSIVQCVLHPVAWRADWTRKSFVTLFAARPQSQPYSEFLGPFFKYVDQILPIIDHLPTQLWLTLVKKFLYCYKWKNHIDVSSTTWMQLDVKILWLIKNNQGLLKYSLHILNLQVYFLKNWLRNFSNLFNIFFAKRQQILGLRNDSSMNVHSNNNKNEVMNPE